MISPFTSSKGGSEVHAADLERAAGGARLTRANRNSELCTSLGDRGGRSIGVRNEKREAGPSV